MAKRTLRVSFTAVARLVVTVALVAGSLGASQPASATITAVVAAPPDLYIPSAPSDYAIEDIPAPLLSAYRYAAADAECDVPWTVLAGIGKVASNHGRVFGTRRTISGTVYPAILSDALDGTDGRLAIADTDGGNWDGDAEWDRAVGPFQFIPSTWAVYAADGNGDRARDPQNLWDAATAAAAHLCAFGADDPDTVDQAISAYYFSDTFIEPVLSAALAYSGEQLPPTRLHLQDQVGLLALDEESTMLSVYASIAGDAPVELTDGPRDRTTFGDWDGDGIDDLGLVAEDATGARFVQGDEAAPTRSVAVAPTAIPLAGDWNGDFIDDGAIYDSFDQKGRFEMLGPDGEVVRTVMFGDWGDQPLTGDWDGDGVSEIAVYKPASEEFGRPVGVFLRGDGLGNLVGPPIKAGGPGAIAVVGDWDGDGRDSLGLYAPNTGDAIEAAVSALADLRAEAAAEAAAAAEEANEEAGAEAANDASTTAQSVEDAGDFEKVLDGSPEAQDSHSHTHSHAGDTADVPTRNADRSEATAGAEVDAAIDADVYALGSQIATFDERGTVIDLAAFTTQGTPVAGVLPKPPVEEVTSDPIDPGIPGAPVVDLSELVSLDGVTYYGEELAPDGSMLRLWRVRDIVVNETYAVNLWNLLEAARADGILLEGWGWRSNAQQIRLREQNCGNVYTAQPSTCSPPTAIPGTSRHEWGLAIDFHVGGSSLRSGSPEFQWLVQNARDYAFINLPSEAWHWSDTGG